ncbi:FAR1 domain-containing protein, partial [Cephalotus follicularis]
VGDDIIEPVVVDEENNDNKCNVGKSFPEKPCVSQEFDTLDEVYNFYNFYALREGFGIRKSSNSKSQAIGELIWKKNLCNKAGFKDLSNVKEDGREVVHRHRDTREGCKPKIDVRKSKNEKWVVPR